MGGPSGSLTFRAKATAMTGSFAVGKEQAPLRLIEYVVAHEIVHVLHADHGRSFWSALGRVMPDYEGRREALRKIGATFEW